MAQPTQKNIRITMAIKKKKTKKKKANYSNKLVFGTRFCSFHGKLAIVSTSTLWY